MVGAALIIKQFCFHLSNEGIFETVDLMNPVVIPCSLYQDALGTLGLQSTLGFGWVNLERVLRNTLLGIRDSVISISILAQLSNYKYPITRTRPTSTNH